jgi:P-type conjugative transfer protein TrbG
VRWQITPAVYGAGVDGTPIIVVKPTASGLDTNLLVTTDRRAYYLRLISKPDDYVSRVAFEYPAEDNNRRWQEHMLTERSRQSEKAELLPALVTAERLNFSYDIHGGNEHIRPLRVFDDGEKTYLQMPAEMKNREALSIRQYLLGQQKTLTRYSVPESVARRVHTMLFNPLG